MGHGEEILLRRFITNQLREADFHFKTPLKIHSVAISQTLGTDRTKYPILPNSRIAIQTISHQHSPPYSTIH